MHKDELGIIIINTNEEGLITDCQSTVSLPDTANKFSIGCQLLGNDGKIYTNAGTLAVPSWQDVNSISTSEIADGAVTNAKINTSAGIVLSKLASIGVGKLVVGAVSTGIPTATTMTGVIEISGAGLTSFTANQDLTGGIVGKIALPNGTPVNAVASKGTITVGGVPLADDTFVIGTQTYIFKALRSVAGEVTIGGDAPETVTNIVSAITADQTDVTAVDGAGDTVVITAVTKGASGNSIVFTENATNITVDGSGTLGTTVTGVDGTVGSARETYVDTSYIYVCTGANSLSGTNWRRVSLGSAY